MSEGSQGGQRFGGLELGAPAVVHVFSEVLKRGPISRRDVAERTGLSQAAVTKAVAPLVDQGIIDLHDVSREAVRGRPVQPISVNEEAALVIGVTVRAEELFAVVTTLRARVLSQVVQPLAGSSVETVVSAVSGLVAEVLADLGDEAQRVAGVGIAVSGDVDKHMGVVRESPRHNWEGVPLGALLAERIDIPIVVDNDVRALSIAEEWFGVGVDASSFAIVTIGAGIGCGLFVNGDVVEGDHGVAGELGHLPLSSSGLLCSCGRRGCVETVASSSAILSAVRRATGDSLLTMREAVSLARGGHSQAMAAFEDAGAMIGLALATVANLVGPSVILVAGESVAEFDLFEKELRHSFREHTFGAAGECQIVTQSHTFANWARGAAASFIRAAVLGGINPEL